MSGSSVDDRPAWPAIAPAQILYIDNINIAA